MKILIATQNAPLYLPEFLDRLLPALQAAGHEVVVAARAARFRKSWWAEAVERLRFYGGWNFVRVVARILARRIRAIVSGSRGRGAWTLTQVLRRHGVSRWPVSSFNAPDFVDRVRREGVDLLLSVAAPEIFRDTLLLAPRKGCLNYHSALLPKHRGRQPLFWAMLEGDREVGVSVHEMTRELDAGPILVQRRVAVEGGDTLDRLYWKTMEIGVPAVLEAVEMVRRGDPRRLPNPVEEGSIHRFPSASDAREFRRRGLRFF